MSDLNQFADHLTAWLEYKKESGVDTLDISPETLAALKASPEIPASSTPVPPGQKAVRGPLAGQGLPASQGSMDDIAARIAECTNCPLHASRKNTVPGEGNAKSPDIMFVGEGPGAEEDEQGRPFVGEAGQLLDKMIAGMGCRRDEVFIANIVKCRPPGNRIPLPAEVDACLPHLKAQIALIRPKIIVALGKTAVQGLLHEEVAITRFRGRWCSYEGIDLMPTYHPAYLLRSPGRKGEAWADLKAVLARLGKTPPSRKG